VDFEVDEGPSCGRGRLRDLVLYPDERRWNSIHGLAGDDGISGRLERSRDSPGRVERAIPAGTNGLGTYGRSALAMPWSRGRFLKARDRE